MMVPPEFRRGLTIVIGVITLLEGLSWALLTLYFVAVYACVFDFPFVNGGVSEWSMFYVSYFMGNCPQGNTLKGVFNITVVPASAIGMQPWFIVYSVVSSVWIPASVLLLAASIGKVRGRCASFLYYPWLLVTIVTIILDVVATAVHIEDIFDTANMADYGRFISSTSFTAPNITSYLPALWITLFYIRFVVLWIINALFFLIVFNVCKHVGDYKHRYQQTTPLTKNEMKKRSWLHAFYEGPDPSLVVERTKSQRRDSGSEMSIRRDAVGFDNPFSTVEVHNVDSSSDSGTRQLSRQVSEVTDKPKWRLDEFGIPIEEIQPIPRPQSRRGSVEFNKEHVTTPASTPQPQDHVFDYLGRPTRVSSLRKIGREQPPPSRGPEYLPPAELRSQIPWSYFKPAEELPPKLQRHLQRREKEDEEKPPVPVPDYTFHFNRRPRPIPEPYAATRSNPPVSRQRSVENYPSRYVSPNTKRMPNEYPLPPSPLRSSAAPVQQYPPQQDYAHSRYNPPPPLPPKPIMENIEKQDNFYPSPPRQQKRHEEYQPSNRNDTLPQEYIINPRQPSYYARQPSQEQNVGYSRMPVAV